MRPIIVMLFVVVFVFILLGHTEEACARKNKRRDKLVRPSIPFPGMAPWVILLNSRRQSSIISFTGLDEDSFDVLLAPFLEVYDLWTLSQRCARLHLVPRSRRGRPRTLDARGCLCLVLAWFRSSISLNLLCLLFGTIPTATLFHLRLGMMLLHKVLCAIPEARVTWPDASEQITFRRMIAAQYPILRGYIGVLNGVKIRIHPPCDRY